SHPPAEPCSRPGVRHGPVFDGVHRSPARATLAPEVGAPVHTGVLAGTHTELAADVEALIDRHRGHARTPSYMSRTPCPGGLCLTRHPSLILPVATASTLPAVTMPEIRPLDVFGGEIVAELAVGAFSFSPR